MKAFIVLAALLLAAPLVQAADAIAAKRLDYAIHNAMGEEIILPNSAMPTNGINAKLLIVAAPEEFEPASFVVKPSNDIKDFLPVATDFKTADGKVIPAAALDIRIVKALVQSGGGVKNRNIRVLKPCVLLHDDALVKVDFDKMENYIRLSFPEGEKYHWISKEEDSVYFERFISSKENPIYDAKTIRPLDIKKDFSQQFWLTIHVPADAAPGLYESTIKLTTGAELLASIPVKLRVLPFKLPDPKTNYDPEKEFYAGIYYRSGVLDENGPGSITSGRRNLQQFKAELKNLLEHGIRYPTVVMHFAGFRQWQWNTYGKPEGGGKIVEPTPEQRAQTIRLIQLLKESGMSTKPLFAHTGGNFGFREFYNRKAHKAILQDLIESAHKLTREAAGHDDIYFYGVDEAAGERLTKEFEVWEDMQAMKAKVFTTAHRVAAPLVAGKIAIMISSGVPGRQFSQDLHAKGGLIWNYANPQAGDKPNPFPYRVNFGFGVYSANYDGIATYAYNVSALNPWNDFDNKVEPDLAFVIGTADGVVDTPSWEGYREGIDDVRYATKLRQSIAKTRQGGDKNKIAIADAADAWLGEINVHTPGFDPGWTRLQIIEWILKLI